MDTVWQFVLAAAGGTIIGLVVGFLGARAARLVGESLPQIAITLLAPYVAWILAVALSHLRGSRLRGGWTMSRVSARRSHPSPRVQARAVWDLLLFILNGLIFILIGLQLGGDPRGRAARLAAHLALAGRPHQRRRHRGSAGWFLDHGDPTTPQSSLRRRDPIPPWPYILLVSWIGMRGVVSLAAALALPVTIAGGARFPFPRRDHPLHLRRDRRWCCRG